MLLSCTHIDMLQDEQKLDWMDWRYSEKTFEWLNKFSMCWRYSGLQEKL